MKDYRMGSGLFTPQSPQFMDALAGRRVCVTTETPNLVAASYVKDAAGSTIAIQLKSFPILNLEGSNIGSFWGAPENLQYEKQLTAVTETNGSADCSVYDASYDLEKLFESAGKGRYVAKVLDSNGLALYGWIGGVAVASDVYTFSIFSGLALGTQNWFQGGATAFDPTKLATLQIYKYTSSIALGSADTFVEEIAYNEDHFMNEISVLKSYTDGQYSVDYSRGRVLGRKANADDTEAFTFKTYATYPVAGEMVSFRKVVTTAGTPVPLSATTVPFKMLVMQPEYDNGGWIARGDALVDYVAVAQQGEMNTAGNYFETLYYGDLADIYIDSSVNGEGVTGWYIR